MNGKDIIKAMSIRHDWHVDVCEGRHDTNPIAKIDELCGTSFMKMLTKKREEWEKETAEYFIEAHREIADEDADTHDEDCYICNIIRNLDANEITQKEAENEIIGEALGDEESNSSMRGRKSFEFEEEVNEGLFSIEALLAYMIQLISIESIAMLHLEQGKDMINQLVKEME